MTMNLANTYELQGYYDTKFNKKSRSNKKGKTGLKLRNIEPKTINQSKAFTAYYNNKHLLLHGVAGTGKTFISIFLALQELMSGSKETLTIVRSVVPTRDMGFLPGNVKEKARAYEAPYYSIFTELYQRGDAYDYCKNRNMVHFIPTSFVRGTTINNSIVVVDECQNLTFHELDSIMTRLGDNCKIIFCGDFRQTDLQYNEDKNGLFKFMKVIRGVNNFTTCEFEEDDIVRSNLVKDYIISKIQNGIHT